jgi:transcriptional regulator with XRE-family HTH domain
MTKVTSRHKCDVASQKRRFKLNWMVEIDFATRLRLTRDLLGWRQQRLANLLAVSRETVCRWEMGLQTPRPVYERLLVILAEREGIRFSPKGYPEYTSTHERPDALRAIFQ